MQQASHYYENFGFEWSFKYSKILWYLVSYGIQNRAFYMVVKQLPEKIMIFFNTMVLSQNFKNILFINTPKDWRGQEQVTDKLVGKYN
jgi:hypothetical protein